MIYSYSDFVVHLFHHVISMFSLKITSYCCLEKVKTIENIMELLYKGLEKIFFNGGNTTIPNRRYEIDTK